jgi:hypothetical protein
MCQEIKMSFDKAKVQESWEIRFDCRMIIASHIVNHVFQLKMKLVHPLE